MLRVCVIAVTLLLLLQPAVLHAERLPIKAYSTADGLAHNVVNKIVRDARGFLWFATNDGLSRFDGYAFTNYGVEHGLPHGKVTDLLETTSGELWVATFGGLVRFRPDGVAAGRVVSVNDPRETAPMFATIVPDGEDPRTRAVIVLLESRDGTIWCGTRNGLFRLDRGRGRFALRAVDIGLATEYPEQRYINDLVEDEYGSLWAATPDGLYRRWTDGTAARYRWQGYLAYDHLHDLMKDRHGRIWVGTRYDGFLRISADGSRNRPAIEEHHAHRGLRASWVNQLFETSDGRFWATTNLGLFEFLPEPAADGSRFRGYNRSHGLTHEGPTALAQDAGGNLWVGTWIGAMKIARNGFVTFGRQDGVAGANEIFEDQTGDLYLHASIFAAGLPPGAIAAAGNEEYLDTEFGRLNGRRLEWFRPPEPFVWGYVAEGSVMPSRTGEWWLAGENALFRYAPLRSFSEIKAARPIRIFTARDGLGDVQVYRMFEDSRRDVWFSMLSRSNGLFLWSRATDTLRNMAAEEGFPPVRDELPRAFGEDTAGNIWIGLNSGAARYRNGRFAFFTHAHGLPAGSIVDIHTDAAGRMWLASSRGGLIRIDEPAADRPRFIAYTTAQGLSGNSTEVITEDLHGRIYVSTGRGVDQLDPLTSRVRTFTTEEGLAPGPMVAAYRDRTGALWFGTFGGLSRFVPAAPDTVAPPPILITGLSVAGRPHPVSAIGETAVTLADLPPGGNPVQIDFASLRFAAGERLHYQYRLEGADSDWGLLTTRRNVTYANLSPGRYRFLVRAVNADGVPSPTAAVVAFAVLPPFWLRWWFLSTIAGALAAGALMLHRYRLARVQEIERVRTRIATDLHDDIGANLTRIAILSEVARQQAPAGDGHADAPLSSIATIARESATSMSDIVWAISPDRDTLQDVVRKMRDHAEEVFEARDIALVLDLPDAAHPVKVGVDIRRDLYLIFKEAVNNAARHSGCTQVSIVLRFAGSRLVLEVADDGVGFDPAGESDGHGLASMRRRAERLGASLDIDGTQGAGTIVSLTMPLGGVAAVPAYTNR
jgi:signal transduction histidine kinase/ligand-binding sensor domain-containing protein